jgi:outer membrane lipoprotein carrier protein LolA
MRAAIPYPLILILALFLAGSSSAEEVADQTPGQAAAETTSGVVEALRARMTAPPVLRGRFEQTRVLRLLRRPLISRGRFLLALDHGLLWNQDEPFRSSLLLQHEQMVQRVGDSEPVVMLASEQPVPFAISEVFLNLLSGDGAGLEQHFDLSLTLDEFAWQLTLTPKPGPLASAIDRIGVQGGAFVQVIEVLTTRGDRTTIRMSDVTDQPAELDAAELDALGS